MKKFVVLEGHDAAGKTTVAKELERSLGGVYIKTPGSRYASIRQAMDSEASAETRFLFYLMSVSDASDEIRAMRKNEDVVCDRYFWSSLVGYAAHSGKTLEQVTAMAHPLIEHLEQPDDVILLYTSEEEQIRRLVERRNGSASDAECIANSSFRRNINGLYEQMRERYGWKTIDTSRRDVEDVAEEVERICCNGRLIEHDGN